MSVLTKVLGDPNEKEIKRLHKLVDLINLREEETHLLSDHQFAEKTSELKTYVQNSINDIDPDLEKEEFQIEENNAIKNALNELLPEAFALVREAATRSIGLKHYDVQLMGGVILHQGKIAEMKTGEGKTLVATLPLYLNALAGKGAHLITVNDYLARRDAGWNGPLYHLLGLSVGVIMGPPQQGGMDNQSFVYDPEYLDDSHHDPRLQNLRPCTRQEAYACDITYGTNNEFGFDYLRDNMVQDLSWCVQRELFYAIVDEVDSILIDEARTPLIISGEGQISTEKYQKYARLIPRLDEETDFSVDEKLHSASLTEEGIAKVEKWTGISNIYEFENAEDAHQINQALKARALFHLDEDYIVRNGEIIIVDEFTGRTMPGRRWSDGLHQAIEAKEGVKVQQEQQTMATITFQNYFRLYQKLAGMTGTALTESEEFDKIYHLEVVVVPSNRETKREDSTDIIYKTENGKYNAVINEIIERHQKGQPVLVGTTDITKSERIARLLEKQGVQHNVLNAKFHEKEAEIITNAGQKAAVTIATNMAGRGTDIVLGDGITGLGGLHIIGTERHASRRIDNQLRGRSGRQGDPGSTQFFISLEDEMMRIFGNNIDIIAKMMDEETPIASKSVSRAIESAQTRVEGSNFDARRHVVEYDDVMNLQRKIIYEERQKILEGLDTRKNVLGFLRDFLRDTVPSYCEGKHQDLWRTEELFTHLSQIIPLPDYKEVDLSQVSNSVEILEDVLYDLAEVAYNHLENEVGPEVMREIEKRVMLLTIDSRWVAYLTAMEQLKGAIGLQGYAQKDPLIEYKNEAFQAFEQLKQDIQFEIVSNIFRTRITFTPASPPNPVLLSSPPTTDAVGEASDNYPQSTFSGGIPGYTSSSVLSSQPGVSKVKVGRNEPCPCGSGRKYKRCHGA